VAGKKIRCPFCQEIIAVSAAKPTTALPKSVPAPAHSIRPPKAALAQTTTAVISQKKSSQQSGKRAWSLAGALLGAMFTVALSAALAGGFWLLSPQTMPSANQELALQLEKQRQQIADAKQKAAGDAATLTELCKQLADVAAAAPNDNQEVVKILKQVSDAEISLRAIEKTVKELEDHLAQANAKRRAELAAAQIPVDASAKEVKVAMAALQDVQKAFPGELIPGKETGELQALKTQLLDVQKKTRKDAFTVEALLSRLDTLGVKHSNYRAIDAHALAAPPEVEKSLASLTAYLIGPANDDRERARAIYRWVIDRIAYDDDSLAKNVPPPNTPEEVLKRRLGLCDGITYLFNELCNIAGLEAKSVVGNFRKAAFKSSEQVERHGWCAVKLGHAWHLVEPTLARSKKFDKFWLEFYFLAPPELLLVDRFPDQSKWQLVHPALTVADFQDLYKADVRCVRIGVGAKEALSMVRDPNFRGFPVIYDVPEAFCNFLKVPSSKHLQAGKPYSFRIETDHESGIGAFQSGSIVPFQQNGGVFEGNIKLKQGRLAVGLLIKDGKSVRPCLEYEVE